MSCLLSDMQPGLSQSLKICIYETFLETVLNGITNMSRLNRLDLMIASEAKEVSACAKSMN